MFLSTTQDVWYSVASVCLAVITVFLCLALYRLIKVLTQADEILTTTRSKVSSIEDAVELFVERFTTISGYASLVTEGGKKLLSLIGNKAIGGKKSKRKQLEDEDEE